MDYDPDNPLSLPEQRAIERYFDVETESMVTEGYSKSKKAIVQRRIAGRVICKHSKSDKPDAFVPYLAINYFDRYISRHPLSEEQSETDNVTLIAICCLLLAWKMRSKSFKITESFLERDLKINRIQVSNVMLMILNGLNWRMRAVTAMCFVGFFTHMIRMSQGFNRRTINEIIIQAQGDITFTQFRPSVIAASAVLVASSYQYPDLFQSHKATIVNDAHVKAVDVAACLDVWTDMCKKNKIVMETAELESREGQAGKPSGSFQPSQPAPNEPSTSDSTLHREGQMNFELKWVTIENSVVPDNEKLQAVKRLFEIETDYLPIEGYARDLIARQQRNEALCILKHYMDSKEDLKSVFVALNYFDYFISHHANPHDTKESLNNIAVACLIIARKNTGEFSMSHFIVSHNMDIELAVNLSSCEAVIVEALDGRTQYCPHLEFFDFFVSKLELNNTLKDFFKDRAFSEVLYPSQTQIRFTKFRPSTLAAAALLTTCAQVHGHRFLIKSKQTIIASSQFIDQEQVDACIHEMTVMFTLRMWSAIWDPLNLSDADFVAAADKFLTAIWVGLSASHNLPTIQPQRAIGGGEPGEPENAEIQPHTTTGGGEPDDPNSVLTKKRKI